MATSRAGTAAPRFLMEAVRLRPGMYFGYDGPEALVYEAITWCFAEAGATEVAVSVSAAGSIRIRDNGSGLPNDGTATTPWPFPHRFGMISRVGLASVCAVSERFEVETIRDQRRYTAGFKKGRLSEALRDAGPTEDRGTVICFTPDPEIFGDVRVDRNRLRGRIDELAFLTPMVRWKLDDEVLDQPTGLEALVVREAGEALGPGTLRRFRIDGDEHGIEADCALGLRFTPGEPTLLTYVNFNRTSRGGSHERGLITGCVSAFPRMPVRQHLVGAVHCRLEDPPNGDTASWQLAMLEVESVIARAVSTALEHHDDHRVGWLEVLTR